MAYDNHAGQAARTYEQRDIETADPVSLVVRVFDLTIRHLRLARTALGEGDLINKGRRIQEASRCLSALQTCLDVDHGREVAQNLDRLYAYWQRRLSEGHLRNDDAVLAEVADHIAEISSAWRTVLQGQIETAPAAETANVAPVAGALAR